jgi:WD40 repeat protein
MTYIFAGHEKEIVIVSCSVDKTALVWTEKEGKISVTAKLAEHNGSVNVVEGFYVPEKDGRTGENSRTLVATLSVDSTMRIWERRRDGGERYFYSQISVENKVGHFKGQICITM